MRRGNRARGRWSGDTPAPSGPSIGHARSRHQRSSHRPGACPPRVKRGDPLREEMGAVAGPKNRSAPRNSSGSCSCQPIPVTRPEPLGDRLAVLVGGADQVIAAADEERAALIGQRRRLLGRQREPVRGCVALDIRARSLRREPLANVALAHPGSARRVRGWSARRRRPSPPTAQFASDHHQHPIERCTHVHHCPAHELVKLLCLVDLS
jgi:hypothetical protein